MVPPRPDTSRAVLQQRLQRELEEARAEWQAQMAGLERGTGDADAASRRKQAFERDSTLLRRFNAFMKQEAPPASLPNRRSARRYPVDLPLFYKVKLPRTEARLPVCQGRTLNMSSTGILFQTEQTPPPGKAVELAITWPVQLNPFTGLQ